MSNYTKVTVKKTVYEKAKIAAALKNRSVSNYVENLILKDTNPNEEVILL